MITSILIVSGLRPDGLAGALHGAVPGVQLHDLRELVGFDLPPADLHASGGSAKGGPKGRGSPSPKGGIRKGGSGKKVTID